MTWRMITGDCLDVLPTLDAGSIAAIITDLPYGTTQCAWDSVIPFAPMWQAIERLMAPGDPILLFGHQPFTSALVMSNPQAFRYAWVWNKDNGAGFLRARFNPFFVTEDICVFGLGGRTVRYYPQMATGPRRRKDYAGSRSELHGPHKVGTKPGPVEYTDQYFPKNIINITKQGGQERHYHPTQKPVPLMRYLIETYTAPGETVLDFCAGSGSTGVAALQCGRAFVGIEQDERYAEAARERLAATPRQYGIFDGVQMWGQE